MRFGHRRKSRAQGMVEFALVVPIFLTVLFGIIEFSWAVFGYSIIQSAANEGVRRAMVLNRPASNYGLTGNTNGTAQALTGCNPATIRGTVACGILVLPSNRVTVDISVPNPANYTAGQNVPAGRTTSVTVRYTYAPLIAYPINFGTNYLMTGFATAQTQ